MKIWLFQTGEPLPLTDNVRVMRTGHLAQTLGHRGHEVTWWASLFNHYAKSWENLGPENCQIVGQNVTIRALKGIGYSKNVSLRRFVDHMIVARNFEKLAQSLPKPDVIVAALPDHRLAYAAFKYARQHGIPFVVDLRDRWPWDLIAVLPKPLQWVGRLILAYDFWIAKRTLQGADSVVTMMASWQPWLGKVVGRAQNAMDRLFYLGAKRLAANPKAVGQNVADVVAANRNNWNILFIGAFTSRSWPKIALDICAQLRLRYGPELQLRPGQNIRFLLAGDGDYMQQLRDMVGKDAAFALPGYVNDAEILHLMQASKLGLVTANSDFHAFPNKVFTYMSGGLPIISNLGHEFAQMITASKIGTYCNNAVDSAVEIQSFIEDDQKLQSYAQRCRAEFDSTYNSENIYSAFAQHIESLAAHSKPA